MQQQENNSPYIIDVDMSGFVTQVIEKSTQVPVIVDFWAPWCEPCKSLGPVIEKVVKEAAGAVILAKMNIDETKEIAEQMQIRSVPTVVAFVEGRPVDAFAGVKSESEIREFLEKIAPDMAPSEIDTILNFAKDSYDADDMDAAGAAFSQALQLEAENPTAIAGLVNVLIKLGDLETAKQILSGAPDKNDPEVSAAQAALELAMQIGEVGDISSLRADLEKNPDDHQSRFDLSLALWAGGDREEAADHLLHIFATDKEWQEDGARKQLLKYFEMAGPTDPFTVSTRRKLSSLLFS